MGGISIFGRELSKCHENQPVVSSGTVCVVSVCVVEGFLIIVNKIQAAAKTYCI